jgi:hypothetical protein
MKMLLNYYKDIQLINLPLSLAAALLASIEGAFLKVFIITFLSGGFLMSIYFFEQKRAAQYFFYYNKGLSKIRLLLLTYLINILLVALILTGIMVFS